jgi:hypothetical protein
VDKAAAQLEAERLNRESPDRHRFRWSVSRDDAGAWVVVRFSAPQSEREQLKTGLGIEPHRPDPGELSPPTHRPEWGPV